MKAYTSKEGQQTANLRLRVFSIQLLGGKTDDNQNGGGQQQQGSYSSQNESSNMSNAQATSGSQASEPADDLPF